MKRAVQAFIFLLVVTDIQAKGFPETWAYLMKGEEKLFPSSSAITDVACFSAEVDGDGNLKGGHLTPPALPLSDSVRRYHLVVTTPWNPTLTHIYLNPNLPFRERIISNIVKRSKPFDGIQIDFEGIQAIDGTAYLNFLVALKKALPENKLMSVAVMARWKEHKRKNPNDAFDYPFINRIADRVIVMAYDEHYGGGTPGPIASLPWCKKIYDYALETIDANKLVMGIPLYGRSWQNSSFARAYKHQEILTELEERKIQPTTDRNTGGLYQYKQEIVVNIHYETLQSLHAKMKLYAQKPIRGVAFWRIGQEPDSFFSQSTD